MSKPLLIVFGLVMFALVFWGIGDVQDSARKEFQDRIDELEEQSADYEASIGILNSELTILRENYAEASSKLAGLHQENEDLSEQVATLQSEIAQLNRDLESAQVAYQQVIEDNRRLQEELTITKFGLDAAMANRGVWAGVFTLPMLAFGFVTVRYSQVKKQLSQVDGSPMDPWASADFRKREIEKARQRERKARRTVLGVRRSHPLEEVGRSGQRSQEIYPVAV